jgi:hypothetical protein
MTSKKSMKRGVAMRKTRKQAGGSLAGNPASSWGWVQGTVGNGWTQFMNSLTLNPQQNLGTSQSNNIVPVSNVNAQDSQGMVGSNLKGDIPRGGAAKRRRARKGGSLAAVVSQAIPPFALLGLQQSVGKRSGATRKHRRH